MYVSCDVVVYFWSCVALFESVSVMAKSFRLLSFSRHGMVLRVFVVCFL